MPRNDIGERIDTAFRSPSEAFFFRRPAKPNDTSLPLLHQRSFDSRSGFYWSSAADSPEGGPPRPQEGRRAVPAYQVVQKRQPGSVEKSPPKRAFLRQNTHPVPPLYAAPDGCFKASFRPRQGPKCPEKGVRTLKKRGKNRLFEKDADCPSPAIASGSRRSGRDANKRDEFRASVLRQDSAPFIFARLPKLSIFV